MYPVRGDQKRPDQGLFYRLVGKPTPHQRPEGRSEEANKKINILGPCSSEKNAVYANPESVA